MYINKAEDGRNNICGNVICSRRKEMGLSQRALADLLQLSGLVVDKNAIQRIEAGKRFVTDIELVLISKTMKISFNELLKTE